MFPTTAKGTHLRLAGLSLGPSLEYMQEIEHGDVGVRTKQLSHGDLDGGIRAGGVAGMNKMGRRLYIVEERGQRG